MAAVVRRFLAKVFIKVDGNIMNEQLKKLNDIELEARAILRQVNTNASEGQNQYDRLLKLASELSHVINTLELAFSDSRGNRLKFPDSSILSK